MSFRSIHRQRAILVAALAGLVLVGCKGKPSGACVSDGCPGTEGASAVANCYDVDREEDCQSADFLTCPYTFTADTTCESLGYFPSCDEDGDGVPAEDSDQGTPLLLCGAGGAGGAGNGSSTAGSAGSSGN